MLNICHKNAATRRRCFLYAYQVTIRVRDSERNAIYPLVEPRVFAKIQFTGIHKKMVVLPYDEVRMQFANHEGDLTHVVRMKPDIYSPDL